MSAITPIPADRFAPPADFAAAVEEQDLVYFCCNVGDADAQLILVPARPPHRERRAIVVDAGRVGKIEGLLKACVRAGLLPGDAQSGHLRGDAIALVVATHPHIDHIRGMPALLATYGGHVAEFWDSGYWHPIRAFHDTMAEIEQRQMLFMQPSSGTRRWIHGTALTVLAPAVHLRNRFDTYGVEINNSSIVLRIDYPASRVVNRNGRRALVGNENAVRLILGADAQTDSWAHVATDFPQLHARNNDAASAMARATGTDHLNATVLRISHHGSNRGVNFELIKRINPHYTLVSCANRSQVHNFPHHVTQEVLREALQTTKGLGQPRDEDWKLHLFYTADTLPGGQPLGTIAMRLRPNLKELWRIGDTPASSIDLSRAYRWQG